MLGLPKFTYAPPPPRAVRRWRRTVDPGWCRLLSGRGSGLRQPWRPVCGVPLLQRLPSRSMGSSVFGGWERTRRVLWPHLKPLYMPPLHQLWDRFLVLQRTCTCLGHEKWQTLSLGHFGLISAFATWFRRTIEPVPVGSRALSVTTACCVLHRRHTSCGRKCRAGCGPLTRCAASSAPKGTAGKWRVRPVRGMPCCAVLCVAQDRHSAAAPCHACSAQCWRTVMQVRGLGRERTPMQTHGAHQPHHNPHNPPGTGSVDATERPVLSAAPPLCPPGEGSVSECPVWSDRVSRRTPRPVTHPPLLRCSACCILCGHRHHHRTRNRHHTGWCCCGVASTP